jgi:hypothetical protein
MVTDDEDTVIIESVNSLMVLNLGLKLFRLDYWNRLTGRSNQLTAGSVVNIQIKNLTLTLSIFIL